MRRTIFLILAAALFVIAAMQVIAQTTSSSSIDLDFGLLFRPPSDPRPVKFATPIFRWTNLRGRTVAIDAEVSDTLSTSLASRGRPVTTVLADSSMLIDRFGTTQKLWTITVLDTTRDGTSHNGTVRLRISDMGRATSRDTSIYVFYYGQYCTSLVIDSIDVMLAPFDSIRAGDRTLLTWKTTQWQ